MRDLDVHRVVPTDPGPYRRLRWRARAWTAVTVGVVSVAACDIAARATSDSEMVRRSAAWVFFQSGLVLVVLGFVLWSAWRRSYRTRPQRLTVDDGDGAWLGVPDLDDAPRAHLSLRPDAQVPRRW